MGKFNTRKRVTSTVKAPVSALKTSPTPNTRTALGGVGYTRDTKSELYFLAVSHLGAPNPHHEESLARDARFEGLVHAAAVGDPEWMLGFVTWLRKGANVRYSSLVAGAEACRALHAAGNTDGWARKLISAPLRRADEPGEMLAYWARYSEVKAGKALRLPKPVKRGVADAAARLYTEFNALKWDGTGKGVRFGDVLELTHPSPDPAKAYQGALFRYLLARRHGREAAELVGASLRVILANDRLRHETDPKAWLDSARLREAGMTWEDAMSAVGGKLDKKLVWEAMIPNMLLGALVKNLRNFSDAGIGKNFRNLIALKLDDEEEVRKSMMFPFRFLAAYRAAGSDLNWVYPLEQALNHSLSNVPALPGRTLILTDQSPSMFPGPYYAGNAAGAPKSDICYADQAKVFASALALRAENADLVQYGFRSDKVDFRKGESLLKVMERFSQRDGTDTPSAAQNHFKNHDRVIVLTDEQTTTTAAARFGGGHRYAPGDWANQIGIPQSTPIYTVNLAGYKAGHLAGTPNRHWFGGMTDHMFRAIPLLESGADGTWPWMIPDATA